MRNYLPWHSCLTASIKGIAFQVLPGKLCMNIIAYAYTLVILLQIIIILIISFLYSVIVEIIFGAKFSVFQINLTLKQLVILTRLELLWKCHNIMIFKIVLIVFQCPNTFLELLLYTSIKESPFPPYLFQ